MDIEINDNPQNNQTQKKNRIFIGKLWINTITKEGENKGKKFMSKKNDNKFKKMTIGINEQINIFPNKKRKGVKDADFRISLLTDQNVPEGINNSQKQNTEVETSEIDAIII